MWLNILTILQSSPSISHKLLTTRVVWDSHLKKDQNLLESVQTFTEDSSLVPGTHKKRRSAWYTVFVHAFKLSKMWGLQAIFCFFRIVYLSGYTIMACNESSDCNIHVATDLLNFVRSIIAVFKISAICLHFAHLRFAKPSSLFNAISNRVLILDGSLLARFFFTKQCYMVAISHRGSAKVAHRCYFHVGTFTA